MAFKCGHLAVPLQSMGTVLAWQPEQKMLRCAESWFSKGIFRTSVGKRKRLVGCLWQNVHVALVPAKISICCRITSHDYFGCWDFNFLHAQMCLCWCAFGNVFLTSALEKQSLRNDQMFIYSVLWGSRGGFFLHDDSDWWLIKHCKLLIHPLLGSLIILVGVWLNEHLNWRHRWIKSRCD